MFSKRPMYAAANNCSRSRQKIWLTTRTSSFRARWPDFQMRQPLKTNGSQASSQAFKIRACCSAVSNEFAASSLDLQHRGVSGFLITAPKIRPHLCSRPIEALLEIAPLAAAEVVFVCPVIAQQAQQRLLRLALLDANLVAVESTRWRL